MPESDNALIVLESPPSLDIESICQVMTVHKATFLKLARNGHDTDQVADFLQDIGTTYHRFSEALRREVHR